MKTARFYLLIVPVVLLLCQCNLHMGPQVKATRMDTVIGILKSVQPIPIAYLKSMNVIDAKYLHLEQGEASCDTTIQLGKDVFYSVITLSDMKVCSFRFIISINEKTKKPIEAKLLKSDCDIDYTRELYETYMHKYITKDSIKLIKTTVVQKAIRESSDPLDNISSQTLAYRWFIVSPTGKISETDEVAM